MARSLSVVVVGAGIGGLASAIALGRAGHSVRVFERAGELGELGHGITIWTNAIRVLRVLGVADAIVAAGCEIESGEFRDRSGRVLVRTPVGAVARELGAPCIGITRADLQRCLLDAVPRERIEFGRRCSGARAEGGRAVATFEDGREEPGDLVIGADGIRSAVRAALFAPDAPRYAGYNCWRALVDFEHPLCPPGHAFEAWGPGARFGRVSIGGGRTYWFASVNTPPGGSDADARAAVLERFGDWHPPIRELVEATPARAIQRLDILHHEPRLPWHAGRVVLLGDSAHATTPNLGQGACLALEDAHVLERSLAAHDDVEEALRAYERARYPRARAITLRSARLGWIGQQGSPLLCRVRDWCMRHVPERAMRAAFAANLRFEGV